jgi:hypothetical protein
LVGSGTLPVIAAAIFRASSAAFSKSEMHRSITAGLNFVPPRAWNSSMPGALKQRAFPVAIVALALLSGLATCAAQNRDPADAEPRQPFGSGATTVSGELKQWHKVTVTLDGPFAHEKDSAPNPFTDYALVVTFRHASGTPIHVVPGYFAADGNAANTSAESGTQWRAHLSPDRPGTWAYRVSFLQGRSAAIDPEAKAEPLAPFDGQTGLFEIMPSDKAGRDFRAKGRLEYVGQRYLRFAGTGEYFLKAGADAPENLLAYSDFDGTRSLKAGAAAREGEARPMGLKTWGAHVRDWRPGDPAWKSDLGKGLLGALNYLASKGCNAFSFLPYNVGGDGQDVWPFIAPDEKMHYDCSKLDQWGIILDHATSLGLHAHFKLQEQEMDDRRVGHDAREGDVPAALDGGALGPERRLYCRELVARFAHLLALNWNLGEENTQSAEEQRAMAACLRRFDPYDHPIVVHTFPDWQDRVYSRLLGDQSVLTGASLQNRWDAAHQRTWHWVQASTAAGKPWVIAQDEQGPANMGVPPDAGYEGHDGVATQDGTRYTRHDIRKLTLWGTLMAGGAGVEYYFGYGLPQNDLACEDWRSRDGAWDDCRIALEFFQQRNIPFWEMTNADERVGNPDRDNIAFCLSKPGEIYLVYLPSGGSADLDLSGISGRFRVRWFNPRSGGRLLTSDVRRLEGGRRVSLGTPPADERDDWLVVVRRARPQSP